MVSKIKMRPFKASPERAREAIETGHEAAKYVRAVSDALDGTPPILAMQVLCAVAIHVLVDGEYDLDDAYAILDEFTRVSKLTIKKEHEGTLGEAVEAIAALAEREGEPH